jgi:hypothetical protein
MKTVIVTTAITEASLDLDHPCLNAVKAGYLYDWLCDFACL